MFNGIPKNNYSDYVQFLGKVKIAVLCSIIILIFNEILAHSLSDIPMLSILFCGILCAGFVFLYIRLQGAYKKRLYVVLPLNILLVGSLTFLSWHCYISGFKSLPLFALLFIIMMAIVALDSFRTVVYFLLYALVPCSLLLYFCFITSADIFATYLFAILATFSFSIIYQIILTRNSKNIELDKSIVKATDRIILVFDEEGHAFYCNPFTYEILGFEEGEVLGDNWWITRGFSNHVIQEKKDNIRDIINRESDPKNMVTKVNHGKTGNALWIEWRDVLLDDRKLMVIGKDVTEATIREKELELLTLVGDKITNGVMVTNKFGEIEWVNDGFSEIFDYTKEDLMGRRPIEIFKERDTDELLKFKLSDTNYAVGQNYESLQHTKHGERIWVLSNSTPIYNIEGEIQRSIEIFTDITEAKELREEHEHIIANVTDIIYKINLEGRFIYVNKSVKYLTGYSDTEILRMKFTDLVHPKDFVQTSEFYEKQMKNEVEETYHEYRILTKDGDTKWVGQTVKASRNENDYNKLDGFTAVVRNISDKKRFELQLLQKNKDITDSINYAQRIQSALLNNHQRDLEILPPHFLIYKPKDIISGDFYWYEKVEDKLVIAIGDCTGHGVPGALMTSLGVTALNQIVTEKQVLSPKDIMNELDNFVKSTFSVSTDKGVAIQDGMDVAIITIDLITKTCNFCGSRRPLLLMNDGEFEIIQGTKRSIGGDKNTDFFEFEELAIPLQDNTTIYLYSDGVTDQFGGPRDKKLTTKRLLNNLSKVKDESIEQQGTHIEEYLNEWTEQGETGQTDDIVLFGISPFK